MSKEDGKGMPLIANLAVWLIGVPYLILAAWFCIPPATGYIIAYLSSDGVSDGPGGEPVDPTPLSQ